MAQKKSVAVISWQLHGHPEETCVPGAAEGYFSMLLGYIYNIYIYIQCIYYIYIYDLYILYI